MANLHLTWVHPTIGETMTRCVISETATDEILDRVLLDEIERVRKQNGDEAAQTVKWKEDAVWRRRMASRV